ncbi:MAG: shikimate dehydrogenase, partial [Vicinamibacterales bacterium]
LSAETLLRDFRFRQVTDRTAIFGLAGSPIGHSVSPAMHNAACAATGVDAVYLPLPSADADDFLQFATALGVSGASVTIPHKVRLFERADEVEGEARQIGAINTLKRQGQRWIGMNSDLAGFLNPIDARGISLAGTRLASLGAGGAARSVAIGARARGASVTVYARDIERARPVAALANGHASLLPPAPGSWDVLVNCTPIGMHPNADASPLPLSADDRLVSAPSNQPPAHRLVYDLIYNPVETRLLRAARAAGYDTIGGLDMLVEQAIEQFRWWTGIRPDPAPMRAAAIARLSEFRDR